MLVGGAPRKRSESAAFALVASGASHSVPSGQVMGHPNRVSRAPRVNYAHLQHGYGEAQSNKPRDGVVEPTVERAEQRLPPPSPRPELAPPAGNLDPEQPAPVAAVESSKKKRRKRKASK